MTISTAIKAAEAGLKVGGKFVVKHLPTILTAVGTAGVIFGTIQAARKAPEAKVEFEQAKQKWESLPEDARSKPDLVWRYVKVGARYYGIVCLVVGGSIVCFWVANHINLKRLGIAVAGLKASTDYAKDLEDQIKKEGGDKKLDEIKDQMNRDKIQKTPLDIDATRLNATIGECVTWCPIIQHFFISSADRIRRAKMRAVDNLYEQIASGEMYAFYPYSDFLEDCGYEAKGPYIQQDAGQFLGFVVEDTAANEYSPDELRRVCEDAVDVDWTSDMKDGVIPVLALKYGNPPRYISKMS